MELWFKHTAEGLPDCIFRISNSVANAILNCKDIESKLRRSAYGGHLQILDKSWLNFFVIFPASKRPYFVTIGKSKKVQVNEALYDFLLLEKKITESI